MQKKYRLGGRRTFSYIYRKGSRCGGTYTSITYCPTRYALRVGVVSGKRVGKSVVRNTVKRRIKDIAMRLIGYLQGGYNYVIVAKSGSADAPYAKLAQDLISTLNKAGLLKDKAGALELFPQSVEDSKDAYTASDNKAAYADTHI